MGLTLKVPPGYSDLADSALVANAPAFGIDLAKIYDNAVFGLARTEVFVGEYVNGDTIPNPVSPIDGYSYEPNELLYLWGIRATTNQSTGWISGPSLWYCAWLVDQATGKVYCDEWYRNPAPNLTLTHSNDGQLIVYTIAQRQKTNIVMAASPTYSAITGSTVAIDKPLTQLLTQSLNDDAKFSVVNHEVFYLGEYYNGQTVTLPISPADGHTYSAAECIFAFSWRWTPTGNVNPMVQPSLAYGQMAYQQAGVDASGNVTVAVWYVDDSGTLTQRFTDGRIAVFAFCQRSGTPGSITPTANSFAEIDFGNFMPGQPLPYTLIEQMINNHEEALLTPEFFGPTEYADGSTITLPTSPVDGYAYSRSECYYLWEWDSTQNDTGTHLRVPLFWANVNQSTGSVQLQVWRLPPGGPYVDDNNSLCRIKVITVARRQAEAPSLVAPPAVNPQGDSATVNPDAAAYATVEQAGTPVAQEHILNFLDPVITTDNPTNKSTDVAVPDVLGDTGSGGKHGLVPAPAAGDAAANKYLRADATWHPLAATNPYAITFDMGGGRTTPPGTSESLLRHVISANLTNVTLPASLTGSVAMCRTTSTGTYTITINKIVSGVTTAIGTITFTAGNATASFTFSSTVTLSPGDTVEFVGGTADATILGIYITISATRS